ncbi:hypothetical protein LZ30DRAFT_105640 [Colletotrichum cereale]|nr:hypothetical protein LZ30DRAFT_105640 [Colletotrichum cereale]
MVQSTDTLFGLSRQTVRLTSRGRVLPACMCVLPSTHLYLVYPRYLGSVRIPQTPTPHVGSNPTRLPPPPPHLVASASLPPLSLIFLFFLIIMRRRQRRTHTLRTRHDTEHASTLGLSFNHRRPAWYRVHSRPNHPDAFQWQRETEKEREREEERKRKKKKQETGISCRSCSSTAACPSRSPAATRVTTPTIALAASCEITCLPSVFAGRLVAQRHGCHSLTAILIGCVRRAGATARDTLAGRVSR